MAAKQVQQSSQAPFILIGGLVVAGGAFYTGWPGMVAIWAALVITGWAEPPVVLTGPKDSTGYATPANQGEERTLKSYAMWREMKWRLLVPNQDWAPGWPVLGSWIAGVVAAAAAFCIPTIHADLRAANALAAFLIVAVSMGCRRRTLADDICPGARVDSLVELVKSKPVVVAAAAVSGVIAGVAASLFIPTWKSSSAGPMVTARVDPDQGFSALVDYGTRTPALAAVSLAVLAVLGVLAVPWTSLAIEHWRTVVAARGEWKPRWQALKFDPAPFLIDRVQVGEATVDTFMAPAGQGAMAFWPLGPKLSPTIGAGSKIAVLDTPNEDNEGPVPGTRHPLRFEVVVWPMGGTPDFTDPSLDPDLVALGARCALAWACDGVGFMRPVLLGVEALHDPEEESGAWESKWAWPDGPDMTIMRESLESVEGAFEAEVLIDHRRDSLFFGVLTDGAPTSWAVPSETPWPQIFAELALEDVWTNRWVQVLKMGMQAPRIEHVTTKTAKLANGAAVHRQAFMTRIGIDPRDFANQSTEKKLATALTAAHFVSVTGWDPQGTDRQGERHPQALAVYWTDPQVAVPGSPLSLQPPATDLKGGPGQSRADAADVAEATSWMMAGMVNRAFDAARLSRPEVFATRALTRSDARRSHIWEVSVRLHDGVTLSDVRGAVGRLKTSFGVPWLRIAPHEAGCVLFLGAAPGGAKLANPRRDAHRLTALDWEQAWLDAGVSGVGGILPELTSTERLPNNEQVEVLDFKLPTGVDVATVKNALSKLGASTNNAFVEVRPGPDASTVRLLACEVNPLPERVGFDFDAIDDSKGIPFATGVEGEPVVFDHTESPHVLLAGMTGAGKSVMAQAFIYGAIIRGFECYVVDPVKGGADFNFAKDRCRAFAGTPFEAAGLMKTVYEDVVRRKNLNAQHGVGSIDELPAGIRPPHVFVFIDEFTSLMGRSLVPKSDDPAMQDEIEAIEAENQARTEIGVFAGKIAREARSAGVHLGLGTQKLTAKMLDSVPGGNDLKTNLARTLLGKASFGDRASALRAPDDAPRLEGEVPKGRGLWEPLSSTAMVVQTWFEPQSRLRSELETRVPPVDPSALLDLSGFAFQPSGGLGPIDVPGRFEHVADSDDAADVVDVASFDVSLDDLVFDVDLGELEEATDGSAFNVVHIPLGGEDDEVSAGDSDNSAAPLPGPDAEATVVFVDSGVSDATIAALSGVGTVMYLPDLDGGHDPGYSGPWWKIDPVLSWLSENFHIEWVVWVDSEIGGHPEVAELFDGLGINFLAVATQQHDPDEDDLHQIAEWTGSQLGGRPSSREGGASAEDSIPDRHTVEADDPFAGPAWERHMDDTEEDPFA